MKLLESKEVAEALREKITKDIVALGFRPRLAIVLVGNNPASQKFTELKQKYGETVGCDVRIYKIEDNISANELRERMKDIVHEGFNHGVVVQLPLPAHIDAQAILNAVVLQKDVDVLSARAVGNFQVGKSRILPPVVGAIKILFDANGIVLKGKKTVVVGAGKLVGAPVAAWAAREGAVLTIISDPEHFDTEIIKNAEIIISGAGKPNLITGEMVANGAVVVDVGTSEQAGKLVGDVDFESVSKKAALITPRVGGVGPLTVAMIFKNLATLLRKR